MKGPSMKDRILFWASAIVGAAAFYVILWVALALGSIL